MKDIKFTHNLGVKKQIKTTPFCLCYKTLTCHLIGDLLTIICDILHLFCHVHNDKLIYIILNVIT